MRVVMVGATGAVGTVMMDMLAERGRLPIDELIPVASARSEGKRIPFGDETVTVRALADEVFDGADIAFFDVPDEVSAEWAPRAAARGAVVIDKSAAWRMHPDVPLVVPEINPAAVHERPLNIVASANCTTLAMILPLAPLHRIAGLRRVIAASYQAASGAGQAGIDDLWSQTVEAASWPDVVPQGSGRDVLEAGKAFPHPIAMNVIPRCGSVKDQGYTSEEWKLCFESRKIMGLPDLPVTATCVRVPVAVGHGVAVHAAFTSPITPEEARDALEDAPGVMVVDDPESDQYPTPLEAAGRDPCYVGRIRRDPFDSHGLALFCVADNLRKGAALNTVQIAELLV